MSLVLPPHQAGAAAWYGPEMAARDEWLMPLTPADIGEIEQAVEPLVTRDADIAAISVADFPLPSLAPRLKARVREEVLNGRGFLLMRGLPAWRWSLRVPTSALRRSQNTVYGTLLLGWTSNGSSAAV